MTCRIGNELNTATHGALSFNLPVPRILAVLDLCLAPGGFTTATLTHNPRVSVHGITLPLALGGYEVRIPRWQTDTRIAAIRFLDITMLAGEMGVTVDGDGDGDGVALVPATHPDAGRFLFERPFAGEQFDLVFCGGTVVRNHARAAYRCRAGCESVRLLTSQLVLGLGRLRPGGTLVLVMHRADAWDSVGLLRLFAGFADVVLFKPARAHARKSSFYMVARNVQSGGPEAVEAVEGLKRRWREATFGDGGVEGEGVDEGSEEVLVADGSGSVAESLLAEFGEQLVRMARPVFEIQAKALRTAPWAQTGSGAM